MSCPAIVSTLREGAGRHARWHPRDTGRIRACHRATGTRRGGTRHRPDVAGQRAVLGSAAYPPAVSGAVSERRTQGLRDSRLNLTKLRRHRHWISLPDMGISESADPGRSLARFAAFVALIVGVFVLAGWSLDMEQLTHIVPGWPRMVRLTAVGFVLAGASLWMACSGARRTSMGVAGAIAMLGTVMLLAHGSYWDVYFDQLSLGPIPPAVDGMPPPRMAPATAFGFQLLGLSLLFAGPRRSALLHQTLAVAGLLVGWAGLSRFVFGGEPLFAFSDMAIHTALLFLLSCAGVLTLRTDAGIAALLVSDGVGGAMARRLLPAAIFIPLVAGALTVYYERRATFGFEAAVAVFAL